MGYQENLQKLRQEVAQAIDLKTVNIELYTQQLTQLLNSYEGLKQKAQAEIERLNGQLGECRGRIAAAEQAQSLLIQTIAAYNRQERLRIEEEKAMEAERAEKEAVIKAVLKKQEEDTNKDKPLKVTRRKRGVKKDAESNK